MKSGGYLSAWTRWGEITAPNGRFVGKLVVPSGSSSALRGPVRGGTLNCARRWAAPAHLTIIVCAISIGALQLCSRQIDDPQRL